MRRLGILYGYGLEEPDYMSAMSWFLLAAEHGDASAMNEIGLLYENGCGVAQSYEKAREWYEKAAELDFGWAFHNLGLFYQYGCGVEIDLARAEEYYRLAVETGLEEAQEKLDRVLAQK